LYRTGLHRIGLVLTGLLRTERPRARILRTELLRTRLPTELRRARLLPTELLRTRLPTELLRAGLLRPILLRTGLAMARLARHSRPGQRLRGTERRRPTPGTPLLARLCVPVVLARVTRVRARLTVLGLTGMRPTMPGLSITRVPRQDSRTALSRRLTHPKRPLA
jgi:hypothetical protein